MQPALETSHSSIHVRDWFEPCVQPGSFWELIVTDDRSWIDGAPEDPATQNPARSNPAILHESQNSVSAVAEAVAAKTPYNPWQTIRSIGKKAANVIVDTIDTARGISEKLSDRSKLQVIGNLGAIGAAGAGVVLACAGISRLTSAVANTPSPDLYTNGDGRSVPLSPAIEDAHHHIFDSYMPDVGNFLQSTFFEPNWRLLVWYTLAAGIAVSIPTAISAIYMYNKHQNSSELY